MKYLLSLLLVSLLMHAPLLRACHGHDMPAEVSAEMSHADMGHHNAVAEQGEAAQPGNSAADAHDCCITPPQPGKSCDGSMTCGSCSIVVSLAFSSDQPASVIAHDAYQPAGDVAPLTLPRDPLLKPPIA